MYIYILAFATMYLVEGHINSMPPAPRQKICILHHARPDLRTLFMSQRSRKDTTC